MFKEGKCKFCATCYLIFDLSARNQSYVTIFTCGVKYTALYILCYKTAEKQKSKLFFYPKLWNTENSENIKSYSPQ